MRESYSQNINNLVIKLHQKKVIAYPTEAVFSLGCDPDSEIAVKKILNIKQRPWQKGFILIAAHYAQLKKYIDDSALNNTARERIFASWPGFITWVIPVHPQNTMPWLTGQYTSIAVRISAFEPVRRLCLTFGKAIVSTSANLIGQSPARNINELRKQFGNNFPVMEEAVEGKLNPSEIRDAISGKLIRHG